MNVFVTGGNGYLGKALVAKLRSHGHAVVGLNSRECDLRDCQALKQFATPCFDQIFHLAAWTQAGDFCLHHPGEQWIFNQQINTNVLSWWQAHQPQAKFIAIGTSCSYDENLAHEEKNYLAGQPIPSLFTYGMTKRMLYVGLLALARQFGLRYLHVVPSTLYGPGYHEDGRQMHFIFDLIRKVLEGKYFGKPVILWGDGHQRRELIYREDFVECLLELADRVDNETINIGAGQEDTIRGFVQKICTLVDYPFESIQYDTSRYVGARCKILCIDKLRELNPQLKWTTLEEGLSRTIEWMKVKLKIA